MTLQPEISSESKTGKNAQARSESTIYLQNGAKGFVVEVGHLTDREIEVGHVTIKNRRKDQLIAMKDHTEIVNTNRSVGGTLIGENLRFLDDMTMTKKPILTDRIQEDESILEIMITQNLGVEILQEARIFKEEILTVTAAVVHFLEVMTLR